MSMSKLYENICLTAKIILIKDLKAIFLKRGPTVKMHTERLRHLFLVIFT